MPHDLNSHDLAPGSDPGAPRLTNADILALDELMGSREGGGRQASPRAAKIDSLLSLAAQCSVRHDPVRVDATLARIAMSVRSGSGDPALSRTDEAAVDAFVLAGYDASRVVHAYQARARRLDAMRRAIVAPSAQGAAGLVDRTMNLIVSSEAASRTRMNLELHRASRGSGMRLTDLVSVAAVLLIAASVVWPVLAGMREQSRRAMCNANLGSSAVAFASYAEDTRGMLPVVTAGASGDLPWWNVGAKERRSNSANLFELVRANYTSLESLACPGNPDAPRAGLEDAGDWESLNQISYSYRIMAGRDPVMWRQESTALLLADHSPIIKKAIEQRVFDPMANSENHDEAGQHVLFSDGSSRWLKRPVLDVPGHDADMIWLPRMDEAVVRAVSGNRLTLKGTELPAGADDAFVGP